MTGESLGNFDWVTARADCSAHEIFERLKMQVRQDVSKREEIAKKNPGIQSYFGFRFAEEGPSFVVIMEGQKIRNSVRFEQTADSILAWSEDRKLRLEANLTLSHDGQCRVLVAGEEYDLWQFRKMALEDLFFNSY